MINLLSSKMNHRILLAALLIIAFLPVLNWYALRLGDGSGEPLGLLALGLAIAFSIKKQSRPSFPLAGISLLLYAIGLFFLPPLLRTLPALAAIAFLTGMHRRAGPLGLLFLSLPIQASLDFFLGYPFRLITAEGARLFVNLLGYPVERLGVQLSLKGIIVSVDPPCSGLQMLWATAFLTALLATLFQLSYRRTFFLSLLALALCLLANILRATSLFFPESGMIQIPSFAHEGIGLLFFALAGLTLVTLARKLHQRPPPTPPLIKEPHLQLPKSLLALTCAVSATSLLHGQLSDSPPLPPSQETISLRSYQGQPTEEIALSPREESFAKGFPGQLKIYHVSHSTLIIRRITRASRQLHPSYHCLKAEGFQISNSALHQDELGRQFLRYQATRNHESFSVTERIRDLSHEQQWTEVSAWYWHALFHPNSGPWEAETFMTPVH